METRKAHERRVKEGWYVKYIKAPGLDVGSGVDPLDVDGFTWWDYQWVTHRHTNGQLVSNNIPGDRNAQTLNGLADESFQTVYASHILEHLEDPQEALRNWWRVLRPGGHLIVCVPHRDLYEKKKTKPSLWNPHTREGGGGHLTFWLPDQDDPPDTLSFGRVLREAVPEGELVSMRVLDEGYNYKQAKDEHPVGEFAIEAILRKAGT